jgi:hypothetical protein
VKLGACVLHKLLASCSPRLSGIGQQIPKRLQEDVVQTEGLTAAEDMYIREMFLIMEA